MHMGTNHLAHFYLFEQLRDLLVAGSTPAFQSRVVNVASAGHRWSPLAIDDLNLEKDYNPAVGYGSSKTANIYMANQIERLFGARGIHGYSLMPGLIATGLQKHVMDQMAATASDKLTMSILKSPEQGCATTVFAAVAGSSRARAASTSRTARRRPR